jgi:transcriptional regulator with XRE-family HTH domain
MADLAKSFGLRVRELRTDLGITQSQLAEAIDMSVEWVRRIENGGASPSFDTISALAKALRARPADLFGDMAVQPANRLTVAAQGLNENELAWLLEGVRLLRPAALSHGERRGAASGDKTQSNTKRRRTP